MTEWFSLSITFITIAGASLTYAYQKMIDRRSALIDIRRDLYREFIFAIAEVASSRNSESAKQHYQKKLAELHLVASDEVLLCCAEFTSLFGMGVIPDADMRAKSFSKLEIAMRRDCFEKTKITAAKLQESLPFTF